MAGALLKLAVYVKGKNRKKFRQGEEYGSARWGKPEDIKPYMDPEFSNNVILTQTEFLTMNSRPKQPKYARNKNILVIGGSGSGKTRFFVKPNLMQMHSSYVVTDPKGTVLVECGKMLEKGGYVIKSLNTINFRKSMHYNPFSVHPQREGHPQAGQYDHSSTRREMAISPAKISGSRRKSSTTQPSSATSGTRHPTTRKTLLPCSK